MKVSILKQPFKGSKLQNHVISHNFSLYFAGLNPAEGESPTSRKCWRANNRHAREVNKYAFV
jgi:hypothetical protein